MISRDQLEARIEALKKAREQALANFNVINGALQECENWLALLSAEPKKE